MGGGLNSWLPLLGLNLSSTGLPGPCSDRCNARLGLVPNYDVKKTTDCAKEVPDAHYLESIGKDSDSKKDNCRVGRVGYQQSQRSKSWVGGSASSNMNSYH